MGRNVWHSLLAVGLALVVPGAVAAAEPRWQLEGPSTSDYSLADFASIADPEPDIAVGPDDVLIAAGNTISRLPNPNGVGRAPSFDVHQETVPLDTWLGTTALGQLCPTAPRSAGTCVLDHLSVHYDQLHGRFLVLFTAFNTGTTTASTNLTQPRKASWVLLVSRVAALAARAAGVVPGSDLFTLPGGTGVNPDLWDIWYGNAGSGLGTDGFGSVAGGVAIPSGISIGAGNINSLPGIFDAIGVFDCTPGAVAAQGTAPSHVCYLPTNARLGIDNDTITIVSAVVDGNINPFDLSATYAATGTPTPGYAGNRVRVIKKASLYTAPVGGKQLAAGDQFRSVGTGSQFAARQIGDYYDLYTSVDGGGTPVTNTPPIPFTVVASLTAPPAGLVTPPAVTSRLSPLFYEPAQLRGRTLASYANAPFAGFASSKSYLLGAISTPTDAAVTTPGQLFVQAIENAHDVTVPAQGPIPFYPTLVAPQTVAVDRFTNPDKAAQRDDLAGHAPSLSVGDDRPQRVVFREGHLYDARVANAPGKFRFDGTGLRTTVFYDVIQQLNPTSTPLPIVAALWQNGRTFAPMFDIPATASLEGMISPLQVEESFGSKLFVATTFPPLPPDHSGGVDPRYLEIESGDPILPAAACSSSGPSPTSSVAAWPSLFDLRCGEDGYDSVFSLVDPATGASANLSPFGIHAGATTDPNDLSLWVLGTYARVRVPSPLNPTGRWGTYGANYEVGVPASDAYANPTAFYSDVPPTNGDGSASEFFVYAQLAGRLGLGPSGAIFGKTRKVKRSEAARLLVRSQMNEAAIDQYLAGSMGGANTSSFADVPTSDPDFKYIETAFRRGYDPGCPTAGARRFCPTTKLKRREMAVMIIRAKLSNVFPTVLTGCTPGSPIASCGATADNWGLFIPTENYFADNQNAADNPFYPYIQLTSALHIETGPSLGPTGKGLDGKFKPRGKVPRGTLIEALVRAFFT